MYIYIIVCHAEVHEEENARDRQAPVLALLPDQQPHLGLMFRNFSQYRRAAPRGLIVQLVFLYAQCVLEGGLCSLLLLHAPVHSSLMLARLSILRWDFWIYGDIAGYYRPLLVCGDDAPYSTSS